MARFRVRNRANNAWLDCVDTPMYIRTADGDWLPLLPDKFSVRNLYGMRWHDIDDSYDSTYDDPCYDSNSGECGGGPNSPTKGSGNGTGSGGKKFDQLTGYPEGYDLPDAGRVGFGVLNNSVPPTGKSLNRPGIKTYESYDPSGNSSRTGLGTYINPNVPYASVHGRGAVVTETVYAMPSVEGFVELLFASYIASGLSVDVYHMGTRVASTCGKVAGRGRISFQFNPDADDMRIMIRVRTEQGAPWSLEVYPPRLISTTERGNLALDSQLQYDVINFPDVIHPDYIGTPLFPAPCHASVYPIAERIQDANAFEYYHYIGSISGWMYLDYTSWETFDFIEVYHGGRRIATTLDAQTKDGYLYFLYDPKTSLAQDIMVRVVSKDFGSASSLNSVYYNLYCPSERGAREYRHPCGSYAVTSMGHPITEDCIALGAQTDRRGVVVQVASGEFDTKFECFDQEMNLLDTEILGPNGVGTLEFWKDPNKPLLNNIVVRVTSSIGCDWQYFPVCPAQPPKLEMDDFLVPYRVVVVDSGDGNTSPLADPFPWFTYQIQQLGGREIRDDSPSISSIDGTYSLQWGGASGWYKWRNTFLRPLTEITLQWKLSGYNNNWTAVHIYERSNPSVVIDPGANTNMQTFNIPVSIPANGEVWIHWAVDGSDRDGNRLDYIAISGVKFA